MDRRTFLKGLVATAAGILVPASVAAEPERRVWALDRTMVDPRFQPPLGSQYWDTDTGKLMVYRDTGWSEIIMPRQEVVTSGALEWEPGDYMMIGDEFMKILAEEPTNSWTRKYIVERYPLEIPEMTVTVRA